MKKFKRIMVVGLSVSLLSTLVLAGCSSDKDGSGSKKQSTDILDHVDEGQVSGNEDMLRMGLESYGLSDDTLDERVKELSSLLFEECGVTIVCGVTPRDNSVIVQDDRDILWSVKIEGDGDELKFGKVLEASDAEYVAHGIREADEEDDDCPDCTEDGGLTDEPSDESAVDDTMPVGDAAVSVPGDAENNHDE